MHFLRRILSGLLVLCMVVSIIPPVTAAETGDEGTRIILDAAFDGCATVWVDGVEYTVQTGTDSRYVNLPEGTDPGSLVTYSYHVGDASDIHTQYPVGMKVWALEETAEGTYTPEKVEDLTNILQYSGSSIRIVGNKGIRMITSIEQNKKLNMTIGNLSGYTLQEYGTVLAWSSDLEGGNPLVLGPDYAKSNYAYKKGVADPIFAFSGTLMQYTNVLVGFSLDQCRDDIAMRPYMILKNAEGEEVTLYGGIVHRSIGYIAWQNKDVFTPGTDAYNYVWEIINHVYAQVNFETNGGSAVETAFVEKGDTLKMPAEPTRDGYRFVGWYTDAALTQEFDVATAVNDNMTLYAKWSNSVNVNLTDFSADEVFFLTHQPHTVVFSVDTADTTNDVDIYCDDAYVGEMHDDGIDGDAVANDGIFSFTFNGTVEEARDFVYYAHAETSTSNNVTLSYFDRPTVEDVPRVRSEAESILDHIEAIEERFCNETETLPLEQVGSAMEEISSYVEDLYNNGEIRWFEVNDTNVIITLDSGFTFTYMLNIQGTDSIGDNVSLSVTTLQPCLSMYGNYSENYIPYPQGITRAMTMPDRAASTVDSIFDNHTFTNNYDNGAVSLSKIRNFSSNQVILWHGHGGYSSYHHSFLLTGEEFDWTAWWFDMDYCLDNLQGRILEASNGNVCITPKYIDKYCGSMTNSLIYLAACQSGKDSALANAFLNKGATAVIANSETILTLYNLTMEYATIRNMCSLNTRTSNYYTLSEALAAAKAEYGSSDRRYGGMGATPLIFGGSQANNYQFSDNAKGTLSGKIVKASDRSTPITTATVNVMKDGTTISFHPGSDGSYSRELPVGTHYVKVTAEGYIEFNAYANIEENEIEYMETFLLVEGEEGQVGEASGVITNALNGVGIEGVTLDVRKDWNNESEGEVLTTITTDASGRYIVNLPIGNYTLCASKDGFVSTTINIIVQPNTCSTKNGSMTPIVSGDNFRIVLTWGENPRDLDSHVVGTLSNNSSFHVYYGHKSQYDGSVEVCNLDHDDTTSYGPETITLNCTNDKPYYYYIYRYAGSGTVASSGARVNVYQGETLVKTFNVPTDLGNGDYWNVFAIVDGQMVIRNTMTSRAETTYANATTFSIMSPKQNAHPAYDDSYPAKEAATEEATEPAETIAVETTPATEPAEAVVETAPEIETQKIYLSLGQAGQDYAWKVATQDAEYDVTEETEDIYSVELPVGTESITLRGEYEETQICSAEIDLADIQDNNCIVALAREEGAEKFDIMWGIYDPETQEVTFAVEENLVIAEDIPEEPAAAEEAESTEETESEDTEVIDDAEIPENTDAVS